MSKNIQFNATTGKAFRTKLEKYYNAMHSIADLINECNDTVSRYSGIIDTNKDLIVKIESGEKVRYTKAQLETEIKSAEQKIADARTDRDEAKSKFDKAIAEAQCFYTEAMHKGAETVVKTSGTDLTEWHSALADMLKKNGFADATSDNVLRFDYLVGVRTNSAKNTYKANSLVGIGSAKSCAKTFLCAFSEYMVSEKIISPFKHKYVPVSMRKDKNKK